MKKVKNNLPAEQRRAVTVEVVIQLAAEKNPSTITTAEIAGRMNLTQGALFRHFPTKDTLWLSVMEWISVRLLGDVDEVIGKANSPMEALELMFMTHIHFAAQHPGAPRMMFAELQRPDKSAAKRVAHTMLTHYGERLCKILENAMAAGDVDKNLDVSAASVMFIGIVQGLVMQSLIAGDTSLMLSNAKPVFALYCKAINNSDL